MFLTYLVQAKRLKTSIVVFDIVQLFLSLNYSILTLILRHFGFPDYTVDFFSDYLVGWLTQYFWNLFFSDACDADVDIRQDFVLSPILLYCTFYLYFWT